MRCPGQDTGFWDETAIFEVKCPHCGYNVEFFKDEPARTCKKCGHEFINPKMDFGCASYCKFAEQCLGTLPPELLAERDNLLKDRVAIEMKRYFEKDFRRIKHASDVARYAERIVKEEGGNPAVILPAAYLHDIGIKVAEKKYGNSEARHQEVEGPPVARAILTKLRVGEEVIEEVCDIIGHHHHPRQKETLNFEILYDADLIVNLDENKKERTVDREKLAKVIERSFFTGAGKRLAEEILLG